MFEIKDTGVLSKTVNGLLDKVKPELSDLAVKCGRLEVKINSETKRHMQNACGELVLALEDYPVQDGVTYTVERVKFLANKVLCDSHSGLFLYHETDNVPDTVPKITVRLNEIISLVTTKEFTEVSTNFVLAYDRVPKEMLELKEMQARHKKVNEWYEELKRLKDTLELRTLFTESEFTITKDIVNLILNVREEYKA